MLVGGRFQCGENWPGRCFIDAAAGLANHEDDRLVRPVGGWTRNEGVQAFEPMNEPLGAQEIEGAVDGDRGRWFLT